MNHQNMYAYIHTYVCVGNPLNLFVLIHTLTKCDHTTHIYKHIDGRNDVCTISHTATERYIIIIVVCGWQR